MEKIDLKICMGTLCYVMGGAEIKSAIETLPAEIKDYLNVSYVACLGYCDEKQTPPFIELNGRKIMGVSKNNLIQLLKEEVKNVVR